MNGISLLTHILIPLVSTYVLTHIFILLVRRYSILDAPNQRSLHATPTPTAGGFVIALLVTCYLFAGWEDQYYIFPLIWAGVGFATLGGLDDLAPKGVVFRLCLQLMLATFFVGLIVDADVFFAISWVLVLLIVSTVNVFNFMDGVDGFAGTQATLFLVPHLFLFAQAELVSLASHAVVFVACILGFLFLNMSRPAKIFMGGIGSYFIGFNIAAVAIIGVFEGVSFFVPLILFSPFLVDATLTLGTRVCSRQEWWKAHRTHLYQKIVLGGVSPRQLCVRLTLLNCLFCWPAAWMACKYGEFGGMIAGVVYVSLAGIWYYHGKRYA